MTAALSTAERRSGRKPATETVLQQFEGEVVEMLTESTYARSDLAMFWPHDEGEDRQVTEIGQLADLLLDPSLSRADVHRIAYAIKQRCDRYWHHDTLADARVSSGDVHVSRVQTYGRTITSRIEMIETGVVRGRKRTPTPASQPSLLGETGGCL